MIVEFFRWAGYAALFALTIFAVLQLWEHVGWRHSHGKYTSGILLAVCLAIWAAVLF